MPVYWLNNFIWFMFPYFVMGYYLNLYGLFDRFDGKWAVCITLVSGLLYMLLLMIFSRETYIYGSHYTILDGGGWHQALTNIQRTATGFAGTFFILGIIRLCSKHIRGKVIKLLSYLGQNTLQLYVISAFFVFKRIEQRFAGEGVDYVLALVATIVTMIISLGSIELLKKNKITNFLFFGTIRKNG